jgi:hypothetical protein
METVTLDLETLTLGEIIAAEEASGIDIGKLLSRAGHRRALAIFVQRSRSSGSVPSWHEITSLRLLDVSPGVSPSQAVSPSATSNGSD